MAQCSLGNIPMSTKYFIVSHPVVFNGINADIISVCVVKFILWLLNLNEITKIQVN